MSPFKPIIQLLMFLIDELTQILYIVSIIVAYGQEDAVFDPISGVPYLLGSVATFGFSFIIACQFWYYKKKNKIPIQEMAQNNPQSVENK